MAEINQYRKDLRDKIIAYAMREFHQRGVKAVKMDTKEPDRDKKMRASMKVADFPLISGTFDTPFDNVMKPGQKVRAVIRLEEADGVLAVPRGAVFEPKRGRITLPEGG